MPYISLDNLTQYNGRLRDYIDGSFDKLDGANWRKTSAAQSVSCWPIPESPLEPEVTFKFSETQPESGTKGPDNPSTIVGVESVSCNVCESEGVDDTPYSIDLGGTYYGGTVNFATGVMEVTYALVQMSVSNEYFWTSDVKAIGRTILGANQPKARALGTECSTHFVFDDAWSGSSAHFYVGVDRVYFFNPSWNSKQDALDYISAQEQAGTPVQIVYEIKNPYTVPLTPVLVRSLPALSHYAPRQNTIYTPHESVQVGYAKSASKTSEELTNAIISLGGNV